jgi:gamma-polyglutamate biosynthesis protein CapC
MIEFLSSLEIFPLQIFPQGALASSVITTIWLGIFVVAFFNLRFGWILSGLVVPGYLVPLLLIKPWAVLAIFIEGVTAYYLVWLFSEYFSRYGLWSALFGRDRFFALILASIATRVTFDGWILPWLGLHLQDVGIVFDYRNELHSLGLIIVALVANQFWKTGFIKGVPPFVITVGVTWLIVKYILLPYTNFGLGGLSYMYEDIAVSILASPKAYIILVTTAFVASRMNLHYGWDFNGILIPALLALQWYEPSKILISFGESFIILGLAAATLKLPFFANSTIEGARKLLLFFNVGFIYKIALSHFLVHYFSGLKVTDFFAFGYLLSTLLAIKMHDNSIAIRLTRATIQTSFVSIVIASLVGFGLTFLPSYQPWNNSKVVTSFSQVKVVESTLMERMLSIKTDLYRSRLSEASLPLPQEIDLFNQASKLLLEYLQTRNSDTLSKAVEELSRLDYQVEVLENQFIFVSQASNNKYWGVYVFNLKSTNDLLLELPSPQEDRCICSSVEKLKRKGIINCWWQPFSVSKPNII